jgi:LuxR family maltose regulon positive regulatory protein
MVPTKADLMSDSKGRSPNKDFIPAKLNPPRLSRVLPRERLFQVLDGFRDQPVTWITGPAGSGKTTLVSSYIEEQCLPCLWYQIDQGDADIATFFYYMGLAGKKAAPRKRKPLPLLTPEYLLGISTFTRSFFEELFRRLKKPYAVVLDNYQDVLPDSPFHEVIKDALSVIPEEIRVFVLSRGEPPPLLARMRATDAMSMLGWGDLRLDLEETDRMVKTLSREEYPDEMTRRIHEKTDGWVAGLLLFLRRAELEGVEPVAFERSVPEEVFEYLSGVKP